MAFILALRDENNERLYLKYNMDGNEGKFSVSPHTYPQTILKNFRGINSNFNETNYENIIRNLKRSCEYEGYNAYFAEYNDTTKWLLNETFSNYSDFNDIERMAYKNGYDIEDIAEEFDMVQCEACGDWIDKKYAKEYDGSYYCDYCFEERYVEDYFTGEIIEKDEAYEFLDCDEDAQWTDEEDRLVWSDYHDCYIDDDYSVSICDTCGDHRFYVLSRVAERAFYYDIETDCWYDEDDYNEVCGCRIDEDEFDGDEGLFVDYGFDEVDGRDYINSYHGVSFTPLGTNKDRISEEDKLLGIELEIDKKDGYRFNQYQCCKLLRNNFKGLIHLEHDGSLGDYGIEIVSNPMTIDYFKKVDWAKLLKLCQESGYYSHDANSSCGLHIHISRSVFGKDEKSQELAIKKLVNFVNNFFDDFVKLSRRNSTQVNDWCGKYYDNYTGVANSKRLIDRFNKGSHGDRYFAVNLTNDDTIEFRLFRGTLNLASFLASVDIVWNVFKNAKTISWENINNIEAWFKGINPKTLEYINSRKAFENYTQNITVKEGR